MTISLDDTNTDADLWLDSYLIDRLKQHLATIERTMTNNDKEDYRNSRFFDPKKYYDQAHKLLIIRACDPVPFFIINLSDLTEKLFKELHELDEDARRYVLLQAVGRIFEDVNYELYHNSISSVLRVRFEE